MGKKIDDLRIVRNAQMIRCVLLGNSTTLWKERVAYCRSYLHYFSNFGLALAHGNVCNMLRESKERRFKDVNLK